MAQLPEIVELNIGHSIIARAVFVGLESATNEMKNLMLKARV
ncbi:pyridoxine 5'-phosphate synthase [bacterium endosymbiont of Bathymodiolus sp. 5 South]